MVVHNANQNVQGHIRMGQNGFILYFWKSQESEFAKILILEFDFLKF